MRFASARDFHLGRKIDWKKKVVSRWMLQWKIGENLWAFGIELMILNPMENERA